MLTGLYEPSSGDASIYGMSLKSDMYSIRQFIGVCPQHDVLFGSLTVSEHLRFYGQLKCPWLSAEELQDKIFAQDASLLQKEQALQGPPAIAEAALAALAAAAAAAEAAELPIEGPPKKAAPKLGEGPPPKKPPPPIRR